MRLFLFVIALVWQSSQANAAACGTAGLLISGFDSPSSCTGLVETTLFTSTHALTSVVPGTFPSVNTNVEGDNYGRIIFNAAASQLTLTAANFPAGVGTDWSTRDFLFFAYSTTRTTATAFTSEYHIMNGGFDLYYTATTTNLSKTTASVNADWVPLILSMNYARNLGFAPNNVSSTSIRQRAGGATPFEIGYDNLTLQTGGDTPNAPLTGANVLITPSCSGHNVTLTALPAATGPDNIAGYHIYRSTQGAAGPYISHRYVSAASPVFTEIAPFRPNIHYKILPYSISTTAFLGGVPGYFVRGANSTIDPANASALGGVHEDLLSNATAIGPFDQTAGCPTNTATTTPTSTPSATQTSTATATPSSSDTSTVTPTFSATPTATPTSTATPSRTITDTVTPLGATQTTTATTTNTTQPTATLVSTNTPVNSITQTHTFTLSPTITQTHTETPVVTPTFNPNTGAQLFPNPFHPDQGETFHLGNVAPGLRVNIYNIIGEFVIGFTTKGNPTDDRWDSLNANGVRVVTGIYFLQIDGKVYRVAVVRG